MHQLNDRMKKLLFIVAAAVVFFQPGVGHAKDECSLNLLTPNGGEVLKNGQTYKITWEQNNIVNVAISVNGGSLTNSYPVDASSTYGEYVWQTPSASDDFQARDEYKVSISGYSPNGDCAARSESADYFIMNKNGDGGSSVKLMDIAPQIGGDTYIFSWQQKRIDAVSLYYAKKTEQPVLNYATILTDMPVTTGIGGDWMKRYEWDISKLDPAYYYIKVEGYSKGVKTTEDVLAHPLWLVNSASLDSFSAVANVSEITDNSVRIKCTINGGSGARFIDYGLTTAYGSSKDASYCDEFISGLQPGKTYHYRIRRGDNAGNDQTFTTKMLGVPADIAYETKGKSGATASIRLHWKTGAAQSKIYYCLGAGCFNNENQWQQIASLSGQNYYDTSIENNDSKVAYFRVRAFDGSQESGYSRILVASSKTPGLPEAIKNSVSNGKAAVTWQSKFQVDFYANSGLVYASEQSCLVFGGCGTLVSNEVGGLYYSHADIVGTGRLYYKLFANGVMFDEIHSVDIGAVPVVVPPVPSEKRETVPATKPVVIKNPNVVPGLSGKANDTVLAVNKIKNKRKMSSVGGKIILKVQSKGEAYYINPADSNMYYLGRPDDAFRVMRSQGSGIRNADLSKIAIGTMQAVGMDADSDGLTDNFETAIGTDPHKADSDNDGYNDRQEIENKYNPVGSGKSKLDSAFGKKYAGRIFIQTEGRGEAWYINPADNKRYYLGRPADAFNTMRTLGVGISNTDFSQLN
jgi:hypothetical protein